MMHEEFENLSGLTVSYHYCTEKIEPEYVDCNAYKQSFCTEWAKAHKLDICKALYSDISNMGIEAEKNIILKSK